jgi:hypothetical protein
VARKTICNHRACRPGACARLLRILPDSPRTQVCALRQAANVALCASDACATVKGGVRRSVPGSRALRPRATCRKRGEVGTDTRPLIVNAHHQPRARLRLGMFQSFLIALPAFMARLLSFVATQTCKTVLGCRYATPRAGRPRGATAHFFPCSRDC